MAVLKFLELATNTNIQAININLCVAKKIASARIKFQEDKFRKKKHAIVTDGSGLWMNGT